MEFSTWFSFVCDNCSHLLAATESTQETNRLESESIAIPTICIGANETGLISSKQMTSAFNANSAAAALHQIHVISSRLSNHRQD